MSINIDKIQPENQTMRQKITPFLWFDNNAEEAVNFYISLFNESEIFGISHYGEGSPLPKGTVMSINFKLAGQAFMALNGGPIFTFSPAISFFVKCDNQDEIDFLWDKFSDGGEPQRCGWIKDRYGLSWQIVPSVMFSLINSKNPEKSKNMMTVLMKMDKLIIKGLQEAYDL